jgi:hypothetical protein
MNDKLPFKIQNYAMKLSNNYMTYLASNKGKDKIPDFIKRDLDKLSDETSMYNDIFYF